MAETTENIPFWPGWKKIYKDGFKALILDESVYQEYAVEHAHPMKLGFKVIFFLSLPAIIGTMLGLLLDYGTLPKVNLIQDYIYQAFTTSTLYANMVAANPNFGSWFTPLYSMFWYAVRSYGGYPSASGFFLAPISIYLGNFYLWWIRSMILWNVVRWWMKGEATKGKTYGTLTLAVAPQMLVFLNFIPGFTVPAALLSAWGMLMQLYALRSVYKFSWSRSVATLIVADIFLTFFILSAALFGVLIGVLFYNIMF